MQTRIVPVLRALVIITMLLFSQVQLVFADSTSSVVSSTPVETALEPDGDPQPDSYYYQTTVNGCTVYVNAFLLNPAVEFNGPPNPGQDYYGAPVLRSDPDSGGLDDPLTNPPNPDEFYQVGDTMEWFVVAENGSADCGLAAPDDEVALSQVKVTMSFTDTAGGTLPGINVPLVWPDPTNPGVMANDGDLAWAIVPWTVPLEVGGNIQVKTVFTAETDADALKKPLDDVVDSDSDVIGVEGPGFRMVSFGPTPPPPDNLIALGETLDYTLVIENTRAVPITQINVSPAGSDTFTPLSACNGINKWTDLDGNSITQLAAGPGTQAKCELSGVVVSGDPPPQNFTVDGIVTVTGTSALQFERIVTSTAVQVKLPEIDVTKAITAIRRPSVGQIYPAATVPLVMPGDTIDYEILVTNTGDVQLRNIVVTDSLTGPILIPPGTTLEAGESLPPITTSHTVAPEGQDPLQNTVTVTADASGFESVDAQAIASVDVADSVLRATLEVLDAGGNPLGEGVAVGETVRYRLTVENQGTLQVNNLDYVTLALPLKTVVEPPANKPPAFVPSSLAAGSELSVEWAYTVKADDPDPLVNTVRVRGQLSTGSLLYAQAQATVDVINPSIGISATVEVPADTDTVLRGQTVQYKVTVVNKDAVDLCSVQIDQIRRDPNTGLETPVAAGIPMAWPGTPSQLPGGATVIGMATYLVTGEDVDPLDMIFEVNAEECANPTSTLSDRTSRVMDISDVQLNTTLSVALMDNGTPIPLGGSPAPVGGKLQFTYQVVNVSAVTLDNVSATWCILHRTDKCLQSFETTEPNLPVDLGAFDDASEIFNYDVILDDAEAQPFIAQVTLKGTDNKGNEVSIKTAKIVPIATPDVIFEIDTVGRAVIGDTIDVDFRIVNETNAQIDNVRVYNLLNPDASTELGFEEVAFYSVISGEAADDANVETGTYQHTIDESQGIEDNLLLLRARLVGESASGQVLATAVFEVKIVPMVGVVKTGDAARSAGTSVHYRVTITNNSVSQFLNITDYQDDVLQGYLNRYNDPNATDPFLDTVIDDNDFDPWPTWMEGEQELGPEPGKLPPQASVTGTFIIQGPPEFPNSGGVDAFPSPLTNTFIARGTRSSDGATVSGLDRHRVEVSCPLNFNFNVQNLDNDPDDVLGETLRWRVSMTNISQNTIDLRNAAQDDVLITEALEWDGPVSINDIQWPGTPGVLERGQTAWIKGATTNDAYFDKQIIGRYFLQAKNNAMEDTISADFAGEVGGASRCEETFRYRIYSPIQLIKIPDKPVAFAGEDVNYTIFVTNVTEQDDIGYNTYNVTVYDSLLQPSPLPLEYNGVGSLPTTSGVMGPGEQIETTVARTVLDSDPDVLTNVVTAEFPDPSDSSIMYFTTAEAEVFTGNPLRLTKTPSTKKAAAGETITYDYRISNVSPYEVIDISMVDDRVGNLIPDMSSNNGSLISLAPGESFTELVDIPYTIPLDTLDIVQNTATATGTVIVPGIGEREITSSIFATVTLKDTEIDLLKTVHYDNNGQPGDEVSDTFGVEDGIPDVESGTPVHYCFRIENTNTSNTSFVSEITLEDAMFPSLQQSFTTAMFEKFARSGEEQTKLYGGEFVRFCEPMTLISSMGDPLTNLVTLSGMVNDITPLFAAAEVTIDIRGTDLLVTKLPSQTVAFVGDEITYTVTLFNKNATNDIIVDEVIDEFISGAPYSIALEDFDWSNSKIADAPVGMLGADGGQATFTYKYVVEPGDPDPLSNTVKVTGWLNDAQAPEDRTPVLDSTRAVLAVTDSQLVVRKTAAPNISDSSPADCGQVAGAACNTVRYTISITNIGSETVQGVMAVDKHFDVTQNQIIEQIFEGDDLTDTELDPFETAFIYYDLPMPTEAQIDNPPGINPEPLDPFINRVTVYGIILDADGNLVPMPEILQDPTDPYDDDKTLKTTATDSVDIVQPNIRALKIPVTLATAPGTPALYNIQITNTGDGVMDQIVFRDLAGQGLELNLDNLCLTDPAPDCNWTYTAQPYKNYGNGYEEANPLAGTKYDPLVHKLQPLEQLTGTVEVTVPADWAESEFTNVIEVEASTTSTGSTVTDRTSATIDIRDDGILVEKLASVPSATVGTAVEYTLRVTNVGGSPITRLTISDPGMNGGSMTITSGFPDDPDTTDDDSATLDPNEVFETTYSHTLTAMDGELYTNRVTVSATTQSGSVILGVDEASVTVRSAQLGVEKFVCVGTDQDGAPTLLDPCDTVVNIGDDVTPDTVTYYVHVYNQSEFTISNLTVTDSMEGALALPASLTPDDGVPNQGTDEAWLAYTYDVQPGDPDPLSNTVVASGISEGGTAVQSSATADLTLVTGDLILTKSGPAQAVNGQTVTYTLLLEHAGTSQFTIENISVIDPLSDTYGSNPIPSCNTTLLPGQTHQCAVTHTVSLADTSPLVNTAVATGTQDGVTVSDTGSHSLVIATPGLSVTKTANNRYAGIGDSVTYTYRVENTSAVNTINNLVVSESDAGAVFDPPWPTSLQPGEVAIRTWTRTMTAQDPDPYVNTITVTGTVGSNSITADATEMVYLSNDDLLVSNTPNVTFAQDGAAVNFTYTVSNLGASDITGLTISDNLCDDAALQAALPDTLAPGNSASVYCQATAALPGPLVSSVYVQGVRSGDSATLSDTAIAEVAVTDGALLVEKSAGVLSVAPGGTINYTIRVTNVGDETLSGFAVDDPMLGSLSPAPPSTLAPGQSFNVFGSYLVPAINPPNSVVNTVTVTATGAQTQTAYQDSDSVSVAVVEDGAAGTLILNKAASVRTARPGDLITYTFTVQNISTDTTVTGVTLNDPMLQYAQPQDAAVIDGVIELPDLGPGNSVIRSYTVQIPGAWIDPAFENIATVTSDPTETLQDTASVMVDVEVLALEKIAVGPVTAGQVVTYNFRVTNYSSGTIIGASLDDPLITNWTAPLPAFIAPGSPDQGGGATAQGEATVPDPFTGTTFDNTATLLINQVPVDTASVSLDVTEFSALQIEIVDIVQRTSDNTELELLQTGEPVRVTVRLTNAGGTTLTDVDYDVLFDITGATCVQVGGPTFPLTMPVGGDPVEVTCRYTPPIGADDYQTGLLRTVTANASGMAGEEEVVAEEASAEVELVDLQLGVDLTLDPLSALPGEEITFTLTITNDGYSPIGCDDTVGPLAPCHLSFTGAVDDLDTTDSITPDADWLNTLFAFIMDDVDQPTMYLPNEVLQPGDSLVYEAPYTVLETDVPMGLVAMVDGGYYTAALETAELLDYYVVHGEDVAEQFGVQGADLGVAITVVPNPPVYGQTVNYNITVTNTGAVTVENIVATYEIIPFATAPATSSIMLVSSGASPVAQQITGQISLSATTLEPGAQALGLLAKIEDQDGPYLFRVTVYGDGLSDNDATASAGVELNPNIAALGTPTATVDPASLDPNAVVPVVTKTVNTETAQPGGTVTWTVTVRNSWTQAMPNVLVQDNVPANVTLTNVTADRGATITEGQYITVSAGQLNPGETVTLTITGVINADVPSPSVITNTACAQNSGGDQACGSVNVNIGPDVGGLPATGIASTPDTGRGIPFGMLSLSVLVGFMVLMGAGAASRRRARLAALFVVVALIVVVIAVVLAVTSGGDDAVDDGDDVAGPVATATPAATAEGGATTPPEATAPGDGGVMQFPPTPTPYIAPTPAGVRTLIIPKLGDQFDVPVPIVDLPISNRQWDVSGLGYYVGWLEGTTWMDPQWGNTVLAAHVQLGFENPGPFWGLGELLPGDEIIVKEGDTERRFVVQSTTKVEPSDWTVTAPTSSPTLTLITCTEWDNNYGVFSQRMVVRAVPAGDVPPQG